MLARTPTARAVSTAGVMVAAALLVAAKPVADVTWADGAPPRSAEGTPAVAAGGAVRLLVPGGDDTSGGPGARRGAAAAPATVTVVPGDSVTAIAARHAVPATAVARANALRDDAVLRPGDVLFLPSEAPIDPSPHAEEALTQAAHAHGLDPALVKGVAWVESRWRQRIRSHRGAVGVMQVLPATAAEIDPSRDPFALDDNAHLGAAYLAQLLQRYGGDLSAALAAYHQGPGALDDDGPYGRSHRYVEEVLDARQLLDPA